MFAGCNILVEKVEVRLTDGEAETFGGNPGLSLPTLFRPGDQFTLLYKLTPNDTNDVVPPSSSKVHAIELNVHAKALVSDDCNPQILIKWKTGVDFPTPTTSSLSGQNLPPRLMNQAGSAGVIQRPGVSAELSSVTNVLGAPQEDEVAGSAGINLTISGPPWVYVGDVFQWDLFVVNRSDKARTLAIIVIPRQRTSAKRHESKPSLTSSAGGYRDDRANDTVEAVVDDHVVYAIQKTSVLEPAEVVSISTDVRIG